MAKDTPFTEDQWWRIVNKVNCYSHIFKLKDWKDHVDDKNIERLIAAIDELENFSYQLYNNFGDQFNHRPDARRICPNPDCHGVYAYFFADWEYCPKCGTELLITGKYKE